MTEQVATAHRPPTSTRRIVQLVLSLLLVVAIFYFLLRGIDLRLVWAGAKPQVVAAVLVYRALTWLLPIPIGVVCFLWWRRRSFVAPSKQAPTRLGVDAA